jgi:hypothetical protein
MIGQPGLRDFKGRPAMDDFSGARSQRANALGAHLRDEFNPRTIAGIERPRNANPYIFGADDSAHSESSTAIDSSLF